MKQSNLYIPTIKEVPAEAQVKSHQLLLKAGYIQQTAAGIYTYLPMATKLLFKIEQIIKEELDKIGANEIKMPFLQPADLWEASGRWGNYGAELFRVTDRHERQFALAPTHEEVVTDLVKNYLNSYKKFPLNLYQIQTKMRDERRPRFGLLRGREFIMMDGYTFDKTDEELKVSYDSYYEAYKNIFNRLGINYKIVQADNGSMGGQYSHEFMALSEIGEDFIAYEEKQEVAYNVEIAPIFNNYIQEEAQPKTLNKIHTPNCKTIEELQSVYKFDKSKLLKAVAYDVDGKLVITFVMGDKEVETTKVANLCQAQSEVVPANIELLQAHNVIPGFIGPLALPQDVKVLIDQEVKFKKNLIAGANEQDYHLENINLDETYEFVDIRKVQAGDLISKNGTPVKITKGIEIGHIFALGKKYTEALNVRFLNKEQKNEIPTMGSYGIGVSRVLTTIIEQTGDDNGIVLPEVITPYQVHIIPLDYQKNEDQKEFTDKLIKDLEANKITYLLDDRDGRPGVKFKDADLIGLPKQIIIGRKFVDGIIEFKIRQGSIKEELNITEVVNKLK